jgi:glycosyltransferase involved in cell wall biosynthesis
MRHPIPILFTIPNFITAGSGRVMLNIVQRLDRSKFAPAVCVLKKGGTMDREVQELGIPFLELPFVIPARPYHTLLRRAWSAAKVFKPYRFALWHSWHYLDDYTEPIIARMAGTDAWVYTKKSMSWGSRAWLVRSYLSTHIAADNTEMPHTLFNRFGLQNKVTVIHHGIPNEEYSPNVEPRLGLRKKLGIPRTAVVVGTVANLVARKGHTTLLEAIAKVPDVYLLTAGRPLEEEYAKSLDLMVRDLNLQDRVYLLGGVDDIPAFLNEIDIFVLATWRKWSLEGCPVALLEAMSCGRGCVATDIPGSRDLVQHGESGLIIPPEDAFALSEAIRELAASPDLRQRLGEAARNRAVNHFSIEKEVSSYDKLYTNLLNIKT